VMLECPNEKTAVRRMVRKLERQAPGELRMCYEARPCGYALQRWIKDAGAGCVVELHPVVGRLSLIGRCARVRSGPAHTTTPAATSTDVEHLNHGAKAGSIPL
jgi:hypothetical protein